VKLVIINIFPVRDLQSSCGQSSCQTGTKTCEVRLEVKLRKNWKQ
jgi:hypothetical protein